MNSTWIAAMTLRIALYQPDIAGNTGTILRLAACLGLAVDIIEPAGFALSDKNLKRAGMDYIAKAVMTRHVDWQAFEDWRLESGRRLVLASTKASLAYTEFPFETDDILLFGRESAGCRISSMKAPTTGCAFRWCRTSARSTSPFPSG
nr:tRNA (cytidine(34)-2'-O)-methyltransferase [Marinicella sp. W31]MDC2878016.1 tRNA (cytidine(34)-2'-O)-methyltransferase [Marinicella sp. W31]